jgi:hypothetical protein
MIHYSWIVIPYRNETTAAGDWFLGRRTINWSLGTIGKLFCNFGKEIKFIKLMMTLKFACLFRFTRKLVQKSNGSNQTREVPEIPKVAALKISQLFAIEPRQQKQICQSQKDQKSCP